MAEKTTSIRGILSSPAIYDLMGILLGGPRAQRDLIDNELKPRADDRILDLGCGTAAILKFLPETIDYVGLDLSREYVAAARRAYPGRGTFVCGRVEDVAEHAVGKFDLVLAIGLLHHLEDEQVVGLFHAATRILEPTGRVFTVDPCFEVRQNPVARFLKKLDRGQNVRYPEGYTGLASQVFPRVEHRLRRDRLRVPYTHILMESRP